MWRQEKEGKGVISGIRVAKRLKQCLLDLRGLLGDNTSMTYQIPPDLEVRVQAQISTGQFASEEEVLHEALDALEKRQRGLEELQAMTREAEGDIIAGRVDAFDVDKTLDAVRQRVSQQPNSQ